MYLYTKHSFMSKILLLLFHPKLESSNINKAVFEKAYPISNLTRKDMYELYPDFNIDVKKEQHDLTEHEVIIIQHPFYWYSIPPLAKQWIDLVLEHGWAYGSKGTALHHKKIMHIFSSGGTFETYTPQGENTYSLLELMRPLELTYRLCGMVQLPSYVIPGSYRISENELSHHIQKIHTLVEKIAHDPNSTLE